MFGSVKTRYRRADRAPLCAGTQPFEVSDVRDAREERRGAKTREITGDVRQFTFVERKSIILLEVSRASPAALVTRAV
jgi:hypothetical protein